VKSAPRLLTRQRAWGQEMLRLLADENFNVDVVRALLLRQPDLDIVAFKTSALPASPTRTFWPGPPWMIGSFSRTIVRPCLIMRLNVWQPAKALRAFSS
jgi:hypothetical protein